MTKQYKTLRKKVLEAKKKTIEEKLSGERFDIERFKLPESNKEALFKDLAVAITNGPGKDKYLDWYIDKAEMSKVDVRALYSHNFNHFGDNRFLEIAKKLIPENEFVIILKKHSS